jgi:O-antigen/teichoic acid export membrane protein
VSSITEEGRLLVPAETPAARPAIRHARNGLLKNIGYLLGGQVATWGLAILWTVVVPRQIGPIGMGQYVTVWSATGILIVLVGLGTRTVVVTEIARDPASAGKQVAAAIGARLALFLPGAGVMAAYLLFAHFDQYQVVLLIIATLSQPVALVNEVLLAAFQGLERMQYLAYLDVLFKVVTTVGGVVLVLLGFQVLGLVLLATTGLILVLVTSLYWAHRHFDLMLRVDPAQIRRMIVASLPFWAVTVLATFYMWIDSVMLALMSSPAEVGWYGVPTKLFATVLFIPVIIGTATLARLTATHREGLARFRSELTPIVESTLVISLPIAAGTFAISGPLINTLYGRAFADSAIVLSILALAIPATYLNIVVNQSLAASNRQVVWTKVMLVSTIANPLLNLFAIPAAHALWHDAALGAAWSLVATELLMAAAGIYLVRSSIDPVLLFRVGRVAFASLLMAVAVELAQRFGLPVQLGLGVAIMAALAFPLRLVKPNELAAGLQYVGLFRGRLKTSEAS